MRIDQITFTRFLAAISIVVLHFGQDTFLFNNIITGPIFTHSNIAVSYFFVLSGFVMIIAYKDLEVKPFNFYIHRFARIYPLLLFALLLYLFLLIIHNKSIDLIELFTSITCIQAWLPNYTFSLNGPAWSLSVEFFFYALFPLLCVCYKHLRLRKVILIVVLFWIISQIIFHFFIILKYNYMNFHYLPLLHLNAFIIGNITALVFIRNGDSIKLNLFSIFKNNYGALMVLLFLSFYLLLYLPFPINFHNGLLAPIFASFILFLSLDAGLLSKIFKTRFFVFLGDISYGIYILQLPIKHFTYSTYNLINLNFGFWGYVIILIICSSLTYLFIEKPLRKLIISLLSRTH